MLEKIYGYSLIPLLKAGSVKAGFPGVSRIREVQPIPLFDHLRSKNQSINQPPVKQTKKPLSWNRISVISSFFHCLFSYCWQGSGSIFFCSPWDINISPLSLLQAKESQLSALSPQKLLSGIIIAVNDDWWKEKWGGFFCWLLVLFLLTKCFHGTTPRCK